MTNLPSTGPPAAKPVLSSPGGLDDLAALMAEQLAACHAAAAGWFEMANDHEDLDLPARIDALKLAARLVQASASAARAVKQIKGGEFHQRVTVERFDYASEKAARKAREAKAKTKVGDGRKKLEARIDAIYENAWSQLTTEERKTIEGIWNRAKGRPLRLSDAEMQKELDRIEAEGPE